MKKVICIISVMLFAATSITAQQKDFPKLTGPYLGQAPPVNEPVLFAKGIVSTNAGNHSSPAFSPDGKEIYWCMKEKIWFTKLENGIWTETEMLSFCQGDSYMYDNPFITTDGKKMFFTSTRPGADTKKERRENIWYAVRTASGWSEPKPVSSHVNDMPLHWSLSVSDSGTLYFQFQPREESHAGIGDIYYSKLVDGVYTKPVNIGPEINTRYTEICPYIAPDESYIIFVRLYETPKNSGIYISYRDKSGHWLPAVFVLGGSPDVGGVAPMISPDGRYLFYVNGSEGTWWMPADFIEKLKPDELK